MLSESRKTAIVQVCIHGLGEIAAGINETYYSKFQYDPCDCFSIWIYKEKRAPHYYYILCAFIGCERNKYTPFFTLYSCSFSHFYEINE